MAIYLVSDGTFLEEPLQAPQNLASPRPPHNLSRNLDPTAPDWRDVTEDMAKDPQHPDWERYFRGSSETWTYLTDIQELRTTLDEAQDYIVDLEAQLTASEKEAAVHEKAVFALRDRIATLKKELAFHQRNGIGEIS